MRYWSAQILAVLLGAACGAAPADAPAPIRLPSGPAKPVPPAPSPDAVQKLTADLLYVVEADVPVLVLTSPNGLVSVTEDAGPVRIRGRFVDDPTKTHTRTYKGKQVFVVEAAATGRVELLVVPAGAKSAADVVRRTIDVDAGQAPQPPPVPPDPKPDPKPDPAKVDKVWVIVVEEAGAARTMEVAKALNDPFWQTLKPKHDWRHYLSDSKASLDNGYTDVAKKAGFPGVLVLDARDGALLKSFKLTTAADIEKAVREVAK